MSPRYLDLYPSGFHGDLHLQRVVREVASRSTAFVETGTNSGSTLHYVARTYPHLACFSCEPDDEAFAAACRHLDAFPAVRVQHATSQGFLGRCLDTIADERVMFWLDAHGWGFPWPLREELSTITTRLDRAAIFIDDFRIPHLPQFEFDIAADGSVCDFAHVRPALSPARAYTLVYPNYTERTSTHHPLCGWGLILYGDVGLPMETFDDRYLVLQAGSLDRHDELEARDGAEA